ncbi:MAG: amidohydrolase/deacetylase family metallohydrolase [Cyclobacteriaceae bacterium]
MKIGLTIGFFLYWLGMPMLQAQQFDLLIKGGYLIDEKNGIAEIMDLAISDGKVATVSPSLPENQAKLTINAQGLLVCPGIIDPHTHVFVGSQKGTFANGFSSVSPDDFSFRSGVTTVVDAGTSGWRNFETFKKNVIDLSQTRVLAFLNIAGMGMSGKPVEENMEDMDPEMAYQTLQKYPEILVGIKIGHFTGTSRLPFDLALEASEKAGRPLLVECHLPEYSLEEQLARMRPGDIITHSYEEIAERMPIVDEHGMLRDFVKEAHLRGVYFDVGHGGAGFWFNQAIPAVQQGLWPNSFGTDLHRFSMNSGMKNILNVMSKFMNMGMELEEVIKRATWQTAKAIGRPDLGQLGIGAVADIALIRVLEGNFGFIDAGGNRLEGNTKLEAELTIKDGRIVYDLNGLAAKPYQHRTWTEEK